VVAKALLEELVARGLDPARRLFIIDCAAALRTAIDAIFGAATPVQRGRNHTIRAQSLNGGRRSSSALPALPHAPGPMTKIGLDSVLVLKRTASVRVVSLQGSLSIQGVLTSPVK
jgi:hypothetical protein